MAGHLICICRLVNVFGQRSYPKSQVYVCDPQHVVELKLSESDNKKSLEIHCAISRSVKKGYRIVRVIVKVTLKNSFFVNLCCII